jgi:hypothetical protein
MINYQACWLFLIILFSYTFCYCQAAQAEEDKDIPILPYSSLFILSSNNK